MEIIPNSPYETNSKAELRVFKKFKEAFVNDSSYIALHSLNITNHLFKKFGEADFVIISKFGVFVIEVKGGGIEYIDGRWSTRNNQGSHVIQDPFRQAETAMHAIKDAIVDSNQFPLLLNKSLPIGYGVIFPDTEWTHKGSEWERKTICDGRNFRNLENWLKNFFHYWQGRPRNNALLSTDDISELKQFLRPNFELVESLYSRLERSERSVVKLTEDQYKYLDIVSANKQVLCSGGAGTGKTFLAAELARRFSSENRSVAIVCKSNWLRRYLETRIEDENVVISTIESIKVDKKRAGIDSFDILILDEGQDLLNTKDIGLLEDVFEGGFEHGEWYVFHDINNQSGLFSPTKYEVLAYLEGFKPAKVPLTTNCRNTLNILSSIQIKLQANMGIKGTGIGPVVEECTVHHSESSSALEKKISELLSKGVTPESITILSPLSYERSSISSLTKKLQNSIIKLDDYSVRTFPPKGISFAEIKNFKGLENEVIIVVDLIKPEDLKDNDSKTLHYVAMSRARGLLSLIWYESLSQ